MREGVAIGTICLRRTEVELFTERQVALLQIFAAQAVIAIENVRLFNETKEALEQQTATAAILRVIASSPTDLQPVMEAVAENAARGCGATYASIFRLGGEYLRLVARQGSQGYLAIRRHHPGQSRHHSGTGCTRPADDPRRGHRGSGAGVPDNRVPLEAGRGLHPNTFGDTAAARRYAAGPHLHQSWARAPSLLGRADRASRDVRKPGGDRDRERAAVQRVAGEKPCAHRSTRASDGVTGTADGDRRDPPDHREFADRPTARPGSLIFRLEGSVLRLVARYGTLPAVTSIGDTISATRDSVAGRAVSERRTIHVEDLRALPEAEFPEMQARARERAYAGHRTYLATPLLREGIPLGTIVIRRAEARPFSDKQIALLQTFADQAVIAIENVRLFTELGARNRELTEALEQQTATAEILRVISGSPTDLAPVFESILANATRLCEANLGTLFRYDG
jgi:two-component system, NtrC family, sensor kinase